MAERVRCMVVDDEPAARAILQELIELHGELELVDSYGDPVAALKAMNADPPDVLFLDIEMPRLNGFELLAALDVDRLPVVVFVTAYHRYAVDAFDVAALDFVLKPLEERRFAASAARAVAAHRTRPAGGDAPARSLEEVRSGRRDYVQRLPVKTGSSRIRVLAVDEIESVESDGNNVTLYAGSDSYLLRGSMIWLEEQLDPAQFARVHRRHIINIECVIELEPMLKGEYLLVLRSGRRVPSSRTYGYRVRKLFRLR